MLEGIPELPEWVRGVSLWETLLTVSLLWWMLQKIFKALPGVKKFITYVEHLSHLPEMFEDIKKIKHEVFPNSGKSLRDAVDNTNKKLDNTIETVEALKQHIPVSVSIPLEIKKED